MTLSLSIAVVPPSLQSKELISIPTPPTFVRLWLGDCWKQCTAQPECTWGNFISHWFRERECDLGNDKIIYLSNSQINSTASRGYHSLIIIRSPLQTILPHHAQKQKTRHSHSLYPLTAIVYASSLNPQSASIQYIRIYISDMWQGILSLPRWETIKLTVCQMTLVLRVIAGVWAQ